MTSPDANSENRNSPQSIQQIVDRNRGVRLTNDQIISLATADPRDPETVIQLNGVDYPQPSINAPIKRLLTLCEAKLDDPTMDPETRTGMLKGLSTIFLGGYPLDLGRGEEKRDIYGQYPHVFTSRVKFRSPESISHLLKIVTKNTGSIDEAKKIILDGATMDGTIQTYSDASNYLELQFRAKDASPAAIREIQDQEQIAQLAFLVDAGLGTFTRNHNLRTLLETTFDRTPNSVKTLITKMLAEDPFLLLQVILLVDS